MIESLETIIDQEIDTFIKESSSKEHLTIEVETFRYFDDLLNGKKVLESSHQKQINDTKVSFNQEGWTFKSLSTSVAFIDISVSKASDSQSEKKATFPDNGSENKPVFGARGVYVIKKPVYVKTTILNFEREKTIRPFLNQSTLDNEDDI